MQDHSKDGLKMVHVESFIRSMKLSWFKRISFSMADWTRLAAQEIPNTWPLLSYGVKKLKLLRTKTTNLFYVDLLNALICFNQDYDPSEEDILTERLWCSDWTKYETTIARKWDDKGLRFVGDLFDKNTGKIYTKLDLTTIYNIQMTFLCYTALIRSLPQNLQKQVNAARISNPNIPHRMNLILNNKSFTKFAYTTIC